MADCNNNGFPGSTDGWVVSSESCGFLSIGARYVREVVPGEIVELTETGVKTITIVDRPNDTPPAFCIFEYVYFARSDSQFEGKVFLISNYTYQIKYYLHCVLKY